MCDNTLLSLVFIFNVLRSLEFASARSQIHYKRTEFYLNTASAVTYKITTRLSSSFLYTKRDAKSVSFCCYKMKRMNESIRYLVELLDVLLGDCSGIAAGADVLESVFGELFKRAFGDIYVAERLRNAKVERELFHCPDCRFCTFFNGQAIDIYTHCARICLIYISIQTTNALSGDIYAPP